MKKALAFILLLTILTLTACTPVPPPPADCNGEHTDTDGDLVCDVCGEELEEGEEPFPDSFLPVLRFAITSDVHVRSTSNDFGSREKLYNFINSAYGYAESYTPYTALDGIFIIGDLTQDGKSQEYQIATGVFGQLVKDETTVRVTMGNHEMHAFGSGDARFTPENIAKSTERFNTLLGYEAEDWHAVIGGYHFISIANDSYESYNYYDDESLEWLKGEIEAAMADEENAGKPIFVMNHEPPRSDVRGFTGGDTELGELLKDYPLVVDFSGHTHRSILDPQSIWQDGFTAIGTGGLAYLGYNMAGHPTLNNSAVVAIDDEGDWIGGGSNGTRTGAMYYIVEIDAENNIRLKIFDLLTGGFYGEPIVFKVGEGEEEIFTAERAERSVAPVFPDGGRIEVISTDYNYPIISFPTPTGGDLTQYYRIEITADGESEASLVFYRLGGMHKAANPPTLQTTPLRGHEKAGEYSIKIYAVNCYGKESEPLSGSITIGEKSMTPDILNTKFNTDGTATNGDTELITYGKPTVTYDEALGREIASFNGKSGYRFSGIADYYQRIVHSVSIETYFRSAEAAETVAIGANNNSAGFGLYRKADGALSFSIRFNNGGGSKYLTVNTAADVAKVGEWVHAAVVFSGSSLALYVNGEAVTLYDGEGAELGTSVSTSGRLFEAPDGFATSLYVGGDVASMGTMESGFIGDIAAYNIFSRPLTAVEITELYSSY